MPQINEQLKEARAEFKRHLFYGLHKPLELVFEDFIDTWQPFSTQGDKIMRLNPKGEGLSAFLYEAPAGLVFPPHYHTQDEYILVVKGKIEMITFIDGELKHTILEPGHKMRIDAGVHHKALILEDVKIQLTYIPEMEKGWKAYYE